MNSWPELLHYILIIPRIVFLFADLQMHMERLWYNICDRAWDGDPYTQRPLGVSVKHLKCPGLRPIYLYFRNSPELLDQS